MKSVLCVPAFALLVGCQTPPPIHTHDLEGERLARKTEVIEWVKPLLPAEQEDVAQVALTKAREELEKYRREQEEKARQSAPSTPVDQGLDWLEMLLGLLPWGGTAGAVLVMLRTALKNRALRSLAVEYGGRLLNAAGGKEKEELVRDNLARTAARHGVYEDMDREVERRRRRDKRRKG